MLIGAFLMIIGKKHWRLTSVLMNKKKGKSDEFKKTITFRKIFVEGNGFQENNLTSVESTANRMKFKKS